MGNAPTPPGGARRERKNAKRMPTSRRRGRGSPEDAVGGGEVKAAPVHFLDVAHVHVDEGDADAQMELLMGGWEGRKARLTWLMVQDKGQGKCSLGSRKPRKEDGQKPGLEQPG